jgi:hypothetical protein
MVLAIELLLENWYSLHNDTNNILTTFSAMS